MTERESERERKMQKKFIVAFMLQKYNDIIKNRSNIFSTHRRQIYMQQKTRPHYYYWGELKIHVNISAITLG